MTHNEKTVTLKLKRVDICDLLVACTASGNNSGAEKWNRLHEKLKAILEEFDEKHPID